MRKGHIVQVYWLQCMCARGDVEVYIIYYLIVYLLFIGCARVISFRFIGYMCAPGDVEVHVLVRKVITAVCTIFASLQSKTHCTNG